METRTDEDRIVETLVLDGNNSTFDDVDFLPIRQSLYNVQTVIPEYDDEMAPRIVWCRPNVICSNPAYFYPTPEFPAYCAVQGTLPDETFLGALLAVAAYPRVDLMANIFASRPEDFAKYGVYTCRFYVEGEWVDVITDTCLPCARDDRTGVLAPAYTRSANPNEMWICLAEKAYAKAVGSYEAIQKVRIHEALLHLTGGSIQQSFLKEEVTASEKSVFFRVLNGRIEDDTIVLVMPDEGVKRQTEDLIAESKDDPTEEDHADEKKEKEKEQHKEDKDGGGGHGYLGGGDVTTTEDAFVEESLFIMNRLYSVIMLRTIAGFDLVLLHNPWHSVGNCWLGEWGNKSSEWDLYPEVSMEISNDPSIPWSRRNPNGFFWMPYRSFVKYFNGMYSCKLFPSERYDFYCVRGEWKGKFAGGPPHSVREKSVVVEEASKSRITALQKATVAVVIDGDASWFNNPQFRLSCDTPSKICFSLMPVGTADSDGFQVVSFDVVQGPKTVDSSPLLWDGALCNVVATDKVDAVGRFKGQEVSLWNFSGDTRSYYHIVPHTMKRGTAGGFILRVFSTTPILVERVSGMHVAVKSGDWRRYGGDFDTTGGALTYVQEGVTKDNIKWCQNPQFHVEFSDPYSKNEAYLKIVVRRTDKGAKDSSSHHKGGGGSAAAAASAAAAEAKAETTNIGLVVLRAEYLEDTSGGKKKSNQPRRNAMGEVMASKASSLKKKPVILHEEDAIVMQEKKIDKKTVMRKISVGNEPYYLCTSFSSRSEAVILYPRIPRSWAPNGLIVVPCLNEKGVKGSFDVEVFSSEPVNLKQLPDAVSRSVAGEWTEANAGGNHLSSTWKKNPKFILKIRNPSRSTAPVHMRISLARVGTNWRAMHRKDTVGCMIGFYLFVKKAGELMQVYESPFVPGDSIATEDAFMLEQLQSDEEYILMPTTFGEQKIGSFVLSIISETEFSLGVEKSK